MLQSCHMWRSHVTCEGVMSHVKESCHMWRSRTQYEGVMSRVKESCHMWTGPLTWHPNGFLNRSLLQNIVSFIGFFGKRDLCVTSEWLFELRQRETRASYLHTGDDRSLLQKSPIKETKFSECLYILIGLSHPNVFLNSVNESHISCRGVVHNMKESYHMWRSPLTWHANVFLNMGWLRSVGSIKF